MLKQGTVPCKAGASEVMMLTEINVHPSASPNKHVVGITFKDPDDPAHAVEERVELVQVVKSTGVSSRTYDFGQFGLVFGDKYVWCSLKSKPASARTIASSGVTLLFEALRNY